MLLNSKSLFAFLSISAVFIILVRGLKTQYTASKISSKDDVVFFVSLDFPC